MWFLGHFALGYFAAVAVRRYTKERLYLPLVWFVAILPDIDVFLEPFIVHRGPLHSVILATVVSIPLLIVFRRGLPYFAALLTHSLIGDYLTAPIQIFWPFSGWYSVPWELRLIGWPEIGVELLLFTVMLFHIYRMSRKTPRVLEEPLNKKCWV